MVGDTPASCMMFGLEKIQTELVSHNVEKCLFRSWKKVLSYAASHIKIVIIRDLLLIITPYFLLSVYNHLSTYY
ncbi:hypothetical protein SDC9_129934 [bioreactor metagenome]|uniref:Uncharacterized protein n=1 Tax=bioreactor metagenome TaxID=1076179 RepID=A0A645D2A8_9ZZZZ